MTDIYVGTLFSEDYLAHHGILGMKWGVRRYENKDGTLTEAGKKRYANNYTSEQRKRDERVYGKGAVKRINKKMLNGEQISSARSYEADRIETARKSAMMLGHVGRAAGGIAGYYLGTKLKIDDPVVKQYVSIGIAGVGTMLGKDAAQSLGMMSRGYRPSKYRD